MSQLTITTLRFQRSRSAPPTGASTKPGSMRATITRPMPVPDVDTLLRDREDREEPGPVAETRDELRAEEREEARSAKHPPRRRRNRILVGRGRYERRLVAHATGQPRFPVALTPGTSRVRPSPSSVVFFAVAFFAAFFAAFFVGLLRDLLGGLLRRLLRGLLGLLRRRPRRAPAAGRPPRRA